MKQQKTIKNKKKIELEACWSPSTICKAFKLPRNQDLKKIVLQVEHCCKYVFYQNIYKLSFLLIIRLFLTNDNVLKGDSFINNVRKYLQPKFSVLGEKSSDKMIMQK